MSHNVGAGKHMLNSFLTNPGASLTARWILALVFIPALAHNLKAPAAFFATVGNYRLLPQRLVAACSYAMLVFELAAVNGLIANSRIGSAVATISLAIYTAAISINLVRGRIDIVCGCSGPTMRQTLSSWILIRNVVLLIAALLATSPSSLCPLTMLDWFSTIAAMATFILVYTAADQLAAFKARFGR